MNAVATSSGVSTSLKRLRSSSSDEEERIKQIKRPIYFYKLASSDSESSGSRDSVYSVQARSTDIAKDTSDTATESSDVEYDVVSLSDRPLYPFPSQSSSSEPEDINRQIDFTIPIESESDNFDRSSITSEIRKDCRRLHVYTKCILCGGMNVIPFYQYCPKCYKVRKNFFPPRPKRRKSAKKALQQQDSGISEGFSAPITLDVPSSERPSDPDDSSEKKELCGTCLVQPKNGAYVHNNIIHRYSCYECSIKIYKKIGRCPICNTRVLRVCKDIVI